MNLEEKFSLAVVAVMSETKTLTFESVEAFIKGNKTKPADPKFMSKKSTLETESLEVYIFKKGMLLINLDP